MTKIYVKEFSFKGHNRGLCRKCGKFHKSPKTFGIPNKKLFDINILGGRICKLRLDNGLTQRELAEKIGLKREAIKSYELNTIRPSIPIAKKLMNIFPSLKVDLNKLPRFRGDGSSVINIEKKLTSEKAYII